MNKQNRFTLLELMMVIVVLSAISYVALDAAGSNVNQVRYEETRQRLKNIRTAILGPTGQAVWEHGILSGFVVDNGRLPKNIDELVNLPPLSSEKLEKIKIQPKKPVFYPKIDKDGYNDGSTTSFEIDQQLMKGHRGSYLSGTYHSSDLRKYVFRDGWRTINSDSSRDEADHGWDVTTSSNSFEVTSLGMDGVDNNDADSLTNLYEKDIELYPSVTKNDWIVPLTNIVIYNYTNNTYKLSSNVFASLLVYENTQNGETKWRRVATKPTTIEHKILANEQRTLAFENVSVPIGEHILILCEKNNGGDELFEHPDDPNQPNGATHYIFSRIKVFPRGGSPEMILEIK